MFQILGEEQAARGQSKALEEAKSMAAGTAGPAHDLEWTGERLERVRTFGGFNTCSTTGVLGYQCKRL